MVNSIHLYLFTIILSNFLIPQLCLNTAIIAQCEIQNDECTCLVFLQHFASISEFQLQTFPILPCV